MALMIFAVALLVRLLHVLQMRRSPFFSVLMGDSHGYDEWAQRLARGDWLGQEVFYQAPLYPYLLGTLYAIAGRHLLLVRVVQIVLGSASCALLALAVARLFGRRAGIAAGLMLALYAPAIFFDGLLQKSVLDVFFVCLALWLITKTNVCNAELAAPAETDPETSLRSLRFLRSSSWVWLCLGLTMGGLALTRENALVFIAVILVWAVLRTSAASAPKGRVLPRCFCSASRSSSCRSPRATRTWAAIFTSRRRSSGRTSTSATTRSPTAPINRCATGGGRRSTSVRTRPIWRNARSGAR
jgi:hypothetical protein